MMKILEDHLKVILLILKIEMENIKNFFNFAGTKVAEVILFK
jgi:hypothetical protein